MGSEKKANVLLVDDKPENLLALETVLDDLGQNLVRASSAREALRYLLLEDFALILLDVQMPGLSGFELAELIRERERTQHTPIIFISATSVNEQYIFRGYSLGAVDYLTKPFVPEILKSKVRFFSRLFLQQNEIKRQARELADANARLDLLNVELEERVRRRTLELEQANKELEEEVGVRRESELRLATEHAVTRLLASAASLETAMPKVLNMFIENMSGAVACQWQLTDDDVLRCVCTSAGPAESAATAQFVEKSVQSEFARGVGLPGQVWELGAPVVLPTTLQGERYPRATYAAAAGLHSAVAFPIKSGTQFFGVIEYFTRAPLNSDVKLLEMLEVIGSEIGQFILKKRFEAEREKLLVREKVLREEAENANRLKDEFLATLSHELRTPLNSILGWSQIVLGDMVDKDGLKAALETIHRNAAVQAQLIEDLLEASRLITGKVMLDLSPTDVTKVIRNAIETVRPRAVAKNIEITTSFETDTTTITCDQNRLQQMIWNLLTNAVKFTPAGGCIDVQFKRSAETVEIVVKDTGAGISSDFLPYVFERFRQQDSTSTRRHDGLGLGLAIVRHLAELHGGTVAAESDGPGKGSLFSISLPASQALAVAPASPNGNEADPEADPDARLRGARIHVVDDDKDACEMLKFALTLRGAEVETYRNAAEAFDAVVQHRPDILLADINMPDEDGYSLIRRIRSLDSNAGPELPAITLTAMARTEDMERALAAGFQVHVAKPVEIDELVQTISKLLTNIQHAKIGG